MPTEALAKSFSKKKLEPTLNATPRVRGKVKEARGRDRGSTILEKIFPGGSWRFAGSNSPVVYRSESVRYIVLDDFDGFEADIGGEGDPGDLADRRTGTFTNSKTFINSTPTVKDASNIEREYNNSSRGRFCVPCPACGHFQYLTFDHLKFDKYNLSWVHCVCEKCKAQIEEAAKAKILPAGKYIHERPDHPVRGFKYNAMVTPLGWKNTWTKIADEFLKCRRGKVWIREKLKTWTNTLMAETFEEVGQRMEWEALRDLAETYPENIDVPGPGLLLACGVDTQDDRLHVGVYAFGEHEEPWLVYRGPIFGDPSEGFVWEQLDHLLSRQWRHESGVMLKIASCAVDSQGHRTQSVYNYARTRAPLVMAIQGASKPGRPVIGRPTDQDINWQGERIKGGVQLWTVGTDTVKGVLFPKMQSAGQPGGFHFPKSAPDNYFQQMTGEKLTHDAAKGKSEFVKIRDEVEDLDCAVYAYAAAYRVGLPVMDWAALRRDIEGKPKEQPRRENGHKGGAGWMPRRKGFLG
jgi:phage terminase large subunit GpA-like protein